MPRLAHLLLLALVGALLACARQPPPVLPEATVVVPTLTSQSPRLLTPTPDVVNFPSATPSAAPGSLTPARPAPTPYDPPDIVIPPALEIAPCEAFEVTSRASPLQGYTLCGHVTVPERHAGPPGGPTLRLAVVIYKSPNRDARPDPLLLAQGGPGGSTLYLFGNSASFLLPGLLQSRDLLLIEQRGTRFSQPFLYCDEVEYFLMETLDDPAGYEDLFAKQEALQRCYQRLTRDGVALDAYNSLENAHDLAYVASALGYGEFNFYGVSYGALLGQHLMREYPDRLRAVVLDSVVPLQTNWIAAAPASASNALRALFAACAASPACKMDHPSLEQTFLETVDRLNRDPVDLLIPTETSHVEARLTGDLLIRVLYDIMYVDPASVPRVVDAVARGDAALIRGRVVDHAVRSLAATNGMYASTMCAEDADYTPADLVDLSGLYPSVARVVGATIDNDLVELCPAWPVPALPGDLDAPVTADVPTLLLAGALDPITPPAFAAEVAGHLSTAALVTFPTQSHGLLFHTECARALVTTFLLDPSAPLDTSCLDRLPPLFR